MCGTGRNSFGLTMLGTPDDATDDRLLTFEKLLCISEGRDGTVEHTSPNE
jgi:hypothetical protein